MLGKYKVFDLISEKVIFISDSIVEISNIFNINHKLLLRCKRSQIYKSRYVVVLNLNNLPKVSQDIRFKLLINSLGFDRSDLYKPTLIDLEFIYNLIKGYRVDEDYYWDFVNTKVKKIIFDITSTSSHGLFAAILARFSVAKYRFLMIGSDCLLRIFPLDRFALALI